MFDEVKDYQFNYSKTEKYLKTENFSDYLDMDWFLFTALAVEKINPSKAAKGKVTLPNNLTIKGKISNNLIEGYAEINLNNVYTYEGNFKNGVFNGNGNLKKYSKWGHILSSSNGIFKDGQFIDGDLTKVFSYKNPYWGTPLNGYKYVGQSSNNKFNGKGKLVHNQYNWTIEGDFEDGYIYYEK